MVPPEGPVSEREARYLGQLHEEVADTIVVDAPGVPERKESAAEPAKTTDETPRTYRVQHGDSLWKIAQAQFGDGYRSTRIYEANRDTMSSRNVLSIGQILKIPER